jgi:hypothetical protein
MTIKNRKAESQLMSIFVPMIVMCILAVSFVIVVSDLGSNYGVSINDNTYNRVAAINGTIAEIGADTSTVVVGDNGERSNVLTSTERLVTGAYNAILLLGNIPDIYLTIIDAVADSIGLDGTIVTLIITGILFSIAAVVIYLALGRI